MRILTIFVDMVRANRLSTFNNKMKSDTPLDKFFKNLGGTAYTNCFTPGPDTGRSLSSFLTGCHPSLNGCDIRVKYPKFFLDDNYKNIFDFFDENNYYQDLFLHQHHILPKNINSSSKRNIVFDESLKFFLEQLELKDNHFIFLDIPTFHNVLDSEGYYISSEKIANEELNKDLLLFFNKFSKDEFDHIIIFSDHGFKFYYELIYQKIFNKKFLLLNEDRTRIVLFHRVKNDNSIFYKDNLVSIEDLFFLIKSFVENKKFVSNRDYIIIEDHLNVSRSYAHIDSWAIVFKDKIYIRNIDNVSVLINRLNNSIEYTQVKRFDEILINHSNSFKEFYEILLSKQTKNSYQLNVRDATKLKKKKLSNIKILFDLWRCFL